MHSPNEKSFKKSFNKNENQKNAFLMSKKQDKNNNLRFVERRYDNKEGRLYKSLLAFFILNFLKKSKKY